MIQTLISNEWKKFARIRNSGTSIFAQIFLAFIVLYLLLSSILLGVMLKSILHKLTPSKEIQSYCIFLFYYFLLDLPIRYWIQELPTLAIKPYLLQNIKKSILIRFLNIRSLFSIFNLIPLVLFIPFLFETIKPQYGNNVLIGFIVTIFFLMLTSHFLTMYLKRKSILNSKWLLSIVLVIILFALGSSYNLLSLDKISKYVFSQLLYNHWSSILAVVLFFLVFFLNTTLLKANFYLNIDAKNKKNNSLSLNWADNFGELISNEIKLIFRNKRAKNSFLVSFVFLLYGLTFYKQGAFEKKSISLMIVVFGYMITSFSSLQYIQFLFSWQTSHFDQLMTAKHGIKEYIKSKLDILRILNSISFTLSLFYAFLDWRIIPLHLAFFLFNIGIVIPFGTMINVYNSKGFDISQSTSFNFQGVGATSYIVSLLPILFILLLQSTLNQYFDYWVGIFIIGLIGLVSLIFHTWWLNRITNLFIKRKYKIVSGFREI